MPTRPARSRLGRLRRRLRGDRGSVALEMAMLIAPILLLVLFIIQVGLVYFAKQAALAASREGVEAGRQYQSGSCGAAQLRAEDAVRNLGGNWLHDTVVTPDCNADSIGIQITARAVSIVPGMTFNISQRAQAPVERWTTQP